MIRKSHSWSLTWTRDKSADQSGPSIVSLPSGQSQSRQSRHWQSHNAGAGCLSHFELRTSYLSRGSSIPALKSDLRFLRPPLAGCSESASIRNTIVEFARSLRGFLGARFLFRFNGLTFQRFNVLVAALPRCAQPWFHSFVYAHLFKFPISRRSTSVHERSTCVHEQSLNVQPFRRPPSPQKTGHRGPNPNPLSDNHPAFSPFRTSNLELRTFDRSHSVRDNSHSFANVRKPFALFHLLLRSSTIFSPLPPVPPTVRAELQNFVTSSKKFLGGGYPFLSRFFRFFPVPSPNLSPTHTHTFILYWVGWGAGSLPSSASSESSAVQNSALRDAH